MIVIKYAAAVVISFFMAFAAVKFEYAYACKQDSDKNDKKKLMVIFTFAYELTAVFGVMFCQKKQLDIPYMIQLVLLWDALVIMTATDIKFKKIPNKLLLLLLGLRFVGIIFQRIFYDVRIMSALLFSVFGMLIGAIVILIGMFISKGGIGAGDMKLYSVIGAFCGLAGIVQVMMYSLFFSAVFGIGMLIVKKAGWKTAIPMAPFILAGLTAYYVLL